MRPRTDRLLLVLLAFLNVVSAYTTVVGARRVLPWPMSDILGLSVQVLLFFALAGFVAAHAPIRRWLLICVFSFVSVYTSFFAYYEQIAGASLAAGNLDRARQAHARLVDAVWEPEVAAVEALERQAASLYALADREGANGVTTGQKGFGPVARKYAEEARGIEAEAAARRADLERLQPRFAIDATTLSAEAIYLTDLETWQLAPDAWKGDAEAPTRAGWLDLDQEVVLLTPFTKVARGELPAVASVLLALLVDGTALVLGTAIHRRERPLSDLVTAGIGRLKDADASVRAAWRQPGRPPAVPAPPGLAPGRLVVRVTGRGSAFLGALYEAVHPETGGLDAGRLLDSDDSSWRIAARVVLDRLRDPAVGWVELRAGRWRVRDYAALTAWLADLYRHACEREALAPEPHESTLSLSLPGSGPEAKAHAVHGLDRVDPQLA